MIEVFRTNVESIVHAGRLTAILAERLGLSGISFDLDDCDRVLRVAGNVVVPEKVSALLYEQGFECRVME